MARRIGILAFVLACVSGLDATAQVYVPQVPMDVPVLVVNYFPVKGDRIDQSVTGDWGATLAETRQKTESQTKEVIAALQDGSLQNIPGADNGLVYQDRRLSNWWVFSGDFDNAMQQRVGLADAADRHRQLP